MTLRYTLLLVALTELATSRRAYSKSDAEWLHDTVYSNDLFAPLHPPQGIKSVPQQKGQQTPKHNPLSPFQHEASSPTRQPLRIHLSTRDLDDPSKFCSVPGDKRTSFDLGTTICRPADVLTEEKKALLLHALHEATDLASRALKVSRPRPPLHTSPTPCFGHVTSAPTDWELGFPHTDFILYVTARPYPGMEIQATGLMCESDASRRPTVGVLNLSPRYLDPQQPPGRLTRLVTRELFRALGFSLHFALYGFLPPNQGALRALTVREHQTLGITSPSIVEKARDYFNCSSLDALELDVTGYWTRRVLNGELMTEGVSPADVALGLSPMTLAFFEDSGHYEVDYAVCSEPGELRYGRAAGCGFIEQRCNTEDGGRDRYFCWHPFTLSCMPNHVAAGVCAIINHEEPLETAFQYFPKEPTIGGYFRSMDYCPVPKAIPEMVCVNPNNQAERYAAQSGNFFSTSSRCFETAGARKPENESNFTWGFHAQGTPPSALNRNSPRCFETRCPGGRRVELRLGQNATWLLCPEDGSPGVLTGIPGYVGQIFCPPASEVCTTKLFVTEDIVKEELQKVKEDTESESEFSTDPTGNVTETRASNQTNSETVTDSVPEGTGNVTRVSNSTGVEEAGNSTDVLDNVKPGVPESLPLIDDSAMEDGMTRVSDLLSLPIAQDIGFQGDLPLVQSLPEGSGALFQQEAPGIQESVVSPTNLVVQSNSTQGQCESPRRNRLWTFLTDWIFALGT